MSHAQDFEQWLSSLEDMENERFGRNGWVDAVDDVELMATKPFPIARISEDEAKIAVGFPVYHGLPPSAPKGLFD